MTYWTKYCCTLTFCLLLSFAACMNVKANRSGANHYKEYAFLLLATAFFFALGAIIYNYCHTIYDGRHKITIHDIGRDLTWHRRLWTFISTDNELKYSLMNDKKFQAIVIHVWPTQNLANHHKEILSGRVGDMDTVLFLQKLYALMKTYEDNIYVSFYCDKNGENAIGYDARLIFENKFLFIRIFGIITVNKFIGYIAKTNGMPRKFVLPFMCKIRGESRIASKNDN